MIAQATREHTHHEPPPLRADRRRDHLRLPRRAAPRILGRGFTPPSEKLNIAGIGISGQGGGVIRDMATENIVALCDVDVNKAAGTFGAFPKAEHFRDYRVLLEKRRDIDAVMIATPDHMHAPISIAALRAGKHVYVEKPMAHSVEEARIMARVGRETGLVTQMGNNGHAGEGLRLTRGSGSRREPSDRSARSTAGPTARASGGCRTATAPTEEEPVPASLDWDLWIGAAPMRPCSELYHPRTWRAGLVRLRHQGPRRHGHPQHGPRLLRPRPRHATAVSACTSPLKNESYPLWSVLTYTFAASGSKPGGDAHLVRRRQNAAWREPNGLSEEETSLSDNRHLLRRRQGDLLCGGWSGPPTLIPEPPQGLRYARTRPFPARSDTVPSGSRRARTTSPGPPKAGFAYSGTFTEALLVGNLALRLQKRIEWDAANMRASNAPEAEALIWQAAYREGFGLGT